MANHLPLITRLTRQMSAKGVPNARVEAVLHLQNCGNLKKGTEELTVKGKKREAMGPAGRAIDRAAQRSGRDPKDYKYVPGRGAVLK
jgi:hypothetical protein